MSETPVAGPQPRSISVEGASFVGVGLVATLANIALYSFLWNVVGLTPAISSALAFLILVPAHFLAYSRIVFSSSAFSLWLAFRYLAALAVSFWLNVGLVSFYWGTLLADPLPAQVLGLLPAIMVNFILFKYFVFSKSVARLPQLDKSAIIPSITAAISILALYGAIVAMLLYTNPTLHADDWRHYRDYFFERDLWGSIIDRQNGHLMISPNILFLANYYYFDGVMSNLAILNAGVQGLSATILAYVVDQSLKAKGAMPLIRLATVATLIACGMVLSAPATQFWAIGLHNHLVVLGATAAAFFCCGLAGRLSRPPAAVGFIASALLASTSFGTGSAAWSLGFAGAMVMRERPLVQVAYLVGGVTAGLVTLGVLSPIKSTALTFPGITETFLFIPVFLGSALTHITNSGATVEAKFIQSFCIGSFGLVLYAALSLRILRNFINGRGSAIDFCNTFFWLIGGFVVVVSILVALGRGNTDIGVYAALYPRFATWSTLFFVAMAGAGILACLEPAYVPDKPFIAASIFTLVLSAIVFLIDYRAVFPRMSYKHNIQIDRATQIAINNDHQPTRDILWRGGSVADVLRVRADLKSRRRNIFKQDWPHFMGTTQPLVMSQSSTEGRCLGSLTFKPTTRADEFKVVGWAAPATSIASNMSALETLFVLDGEGKVAGFARAAFGSPGSCRTQKDRSLLKELLCQFPISTLPGASGRFMGNMKTTNKTPEAEITAIGRDRNGRWCRLELK